MRGRRQDRRPVRRRLLFLHFQFRSENGGRSGGNRHESGFRAAIAIKHFRRVAGCHDLGQRSKRSPDDVHATNQFIRPPVGENLINHQRFNLERLRLPASREGESARDIVDQKPVGFVLLLDQLDQLWREVRRWSRVLLLSTIRFPCRETGRAPICRRPWPFEWGKPTSGDRDISKFFSTP